MKTQFGELVTADLHEGTLTIEVGETIIAQAGKYAVMSIEVYEKLVNGVDESTKAALNLPVVMPSAPNREFEGTLKTYSGFTHSNRNILEIEVAGQENYIGNVLKKGDKVNIQHWA